ncbi:hypothetical protein GCM10028820_01460 [Tessaracoccus terricola]
MLGAIMGAIKSGEQAAAANYEFSEVRSEVVKLRTAVTNAMQRDESEASGFWMEMGRLGRHTLNYFAEKNRFEAEARQLKNQAFQALQQVENFIDTNVAKHAPVPGRLVADAEGWDARAARVGEMQKVAQRLQNVEGWSGDARTQYTTAASVQSNALLELEGVMKSTGAGARAGALLNRAIFYVVGKDVRLAAGRINGAQGSGGGQYYTRTAKARNECYALLGELIQAITGDVAGGSSANLSNELRNTISLPNLLEVGSWPTGTSGAGQTAADTNGVTPDVDDTNLSGGGGGGGNAPGVDL